MSSSKAYLVNLVAAENGSAKVWNSRKPMTIGHPARWTLEKAEGGVRFRAMSDDRKDHFVKDAEIAKNASVVLVPASRGHEEFRVELKPMVTMAAASAEKSAGGSKIRVFACKGEWSVESAELKGKYEAKYEGKRVFTLSGNASGVYTSTDFITVKAHAEDVTIGGAPLKKGSSRKIAHAELSQFAIQYRSSEWKLSAFNEMAVDSAMMAPIATDDETTFMRKVFGGVMAIFALALLISWMIPATPIEAKKEEPMRILIAKKKTVKGLMTAAPKGDGKEFSLGKTGSKKSPGKKGGKKAEQKVAKKKDSAPKAAPAKPKTAVAKTAAPKKSSSPAARSTKVAKNTSPRPSVKPVPVQHSDLYKMFSSSTFRRASSGLVAGGVSAGKIAGGDSAAEARSMGNSRGSGGSGLGEAGGISTRGAQVAGFGGEGDGGVGTSSGYGRGSNSKVSGAGRSLVSLDTGASEVDEGLTRDQVGRVIHAHMHEIRYCYEAAVLRDRDLEGKLNVDFSIGAPGAVRTAGVGNSTVSDRRLHDCILGRLKQWKFPKPKGGVTVAVSYPFMFKTLVR